jgi:hypothetical protein
MKLDGRLESLLLEWGDGLIAYNCTKDNDHVTARDCRNIAIDVSTLNKTNEHPR